jgi:hypothetical protein
VRPVLARRRDRPGRARGVLERVEADLVGVGEGGLLARDRAHAHALLDVEAARLDDPLFQAPALGARVLEVQVRVVDAVRAERAEHALELAGLELVGLEQAALGGAEKQVLRGGLHG